MMNSHHVQGRRQRRRLPHVQRPARSRPLTFWPTYRGAVEWLRRNQSVVDTALDLLEIYPSLIQEMTLDKLWDFISPFVSKCERCAGCKTSTVTSSRSTTHLYKNGQTSINRKSNSRRTSSRDLVNSVTNETHVPVISITYASDEQEPELQALSPTGHSENGDNFGPDGTPRIYVGCLCNHHTRADKLHRHVLHALQHEFYVRSGPCSADDVNNQSQWEDLREADACVVVLDDPSLNTLACFRSICAAWTLDIPTVFLKDSNYSLPTPLPDFILQHNLGLESPDASRASTPAAPLSQRRSATPEGSHFMRKGLSCFPFRASSATSFRGKKKSRTRTKQELRDADMVLHLLNGYRNALVFDEARHENSEDKLRKTIYSLLGMKQNQIIDTKGRFSPTLKTPNTLHPLSKRVGSSRHRHRTFLGVPKITMGEQFGQEATGSGLFDDEEDEDGFYYHGSQSEISINISSASEGYMSASETASGSENPFTPEFLTSVHSLVTSRSDLSTPTHSSSDLTVPQIPFSSNAGKPQSNNSGFVSSRSLSHLQQFQQQLQQDRASFLSSISPIDGLDIAEGLEERQTTYLVYSKSRHSPNMEPRLVKWPPTADEEMAEQEEGRQTRGAMSDTFSDSPVSFSNFRDVDLSMVVNKPRGTDTPDSDSSVIF